MTDRIVQLKALLAAEPNDPFCLYGIAHEHAKLGEYELAVDYFDQTIGADPDELYAYYHKAKCQCHLGEDDAAAVTLQLGLQRARSAGDSKAIGEMQDLLDEMSE
jgi:tetratricopeptide (TPR) repeat protein